LPAPREGFFARSVLLPWVRTEIEAFLDFKLAKIRFCKALRKIQSLEWKLN